MAVLRKTFEEVLIFSKNIFKKKREREKRSAKSEVLKFVEFRLSPMIEL